MDQSDEMSSQTPITNKTQTKSTTSPHNPSPNDNRPTKTKGRKNIQNKADSSPDKLDFSKKINKSLTSNRSSIPRNQFQVTINSSNSNNIS